MSKLAVFAQDQVWVDRNGTRHVIDEMSQGYKRACVEFVERRAAVIVNKAARRQVIEASIGALAKSRGVVPCVIGIDQDGNSVECGADKMDRGGEWAHGVWHGSGPMPGSEADDVYSGEAGLWFESIVKNAHAAKVSDEEAIRLIRATPLMARLRGDLGLAG